MTKRQRPARHAPEKEHDVAQFVSGVEDHPKFDGAAKDQQKRGQRQRNENDENEEQRAETSLPEAPFVARKPIGAAKSLHQRQHQAEPGKDTERDARDDEPPRMRIARMHRREHQAHGIRGKNLP